jgi:hypothetical protein
MQARTVIFGQYSPLPCHRWSSVMLLCCGNSTPVELPASASFRPLLPCCSHERRQPWQHLRPCQSCTPCQTGHRSGAAFGAFSSATGAAVFSICISTGCWSTTSTFCDLTRSAALDGTCMTATVVSPIGLGFSGACSLRVCGGAIMLTLLVLTLAAVKQLTLMQRPTDRRLAKDHMPCIPAGE